MPGSHHGMGCLTQQKDQRLRCGRVRGIHLSKGRSLGGKGLSTWGKERAVSKGVNLQCIIYSVGTAKHQLMCYFESSITYYSWEVPTGSYSRAVHAPENAVPCTPSSTHKSKYLIFIYIYRYGCIPLTKRPDQSLGLSTYKLDY